MAFYLHTLQVVIANTCSNNYKSDIGIKSLCVTARLYVLIEMKEARLPLDCCCWWCCWCSARSRRPQTVQNKAHHIYTSHVIGHIHSVIKSYFSSLWSQHCQIIIRLYVNDRTSSPSHCFPSVAAGITWSRALGSWRHFRPTVGYMFATIFESKKQIKFWAYYWEN